MRILFLAKRRYTNKDTLRERFGRCYKLPLYWSESQHTVRLDLIDYMNGHYEQSHEADLGIGSWPISALMTLYREAAGWRPNLVVASGDCFLSLFGLRIANKTGARFVFDVYDDYRTFRAYKLFMGRDVYGNHIRKANHVYYASRALAQTHRGGLSWSLVPNGVEGDVFSPIPTARARADIGLPYRRGVWIGYFGSLDPYRGINLLVEAVRLLRARGPDVRLLVCGQEHTAARLAEPWIRYMGMVPHQHMPTYISACDVVALPYRRSAYLDMASSCKISEYLFCRRPIAATRTPNFTENFPVQAQTLGERLAEPDNVPDLARVIAMQMEDPITPDPPAEMHWRRIAEEALKPIQAR